MAKTVQAFGRSWSHQQIYSLLKRLVDTGLLVGFWREHTIVFDGQNIATPVLSDLVYCEIVSGIMTYMGEGKTEWLALCGAVEKFVGEEK